jgi:hypothetical protein
MSLAVASRRASAPIPASELDWRASLPVLALLAAQVGLYIWMAPRGFDFTDESYYVLNYLYWREVIGTVTFFGAYFEWPFRLLGQSVPAIRIVSLLLLLASSAYFALQALGFFTRRESSAGVTRSVFAVVGMAASLFYFGQTATVRAPSYNLVALCSMLVATGALLRVLEPGASIGNTRLAMFVYGLAIGACGLGKGSTAAMLVAVHALFLVFANRDWRWRHLLEVFLFVLAGASLNVVVLQFTHPQWLDALNEGMKLLSMDGTHSLVGSLNAFRWEVQAAAPAMLVSAIGAGVAVALVVVWLGPSRPAALSALVVILVGGCVLGLIAGPVRWWLPWLGLAILLLWIVGRLNRRSFRLERTDMVDVALMVVLLALPVAFSFGTNNSILEHSQRAAVFPVVALLLRLLRLVHLGILPNPAFIGCMAALCLPTLITQLRAATDVNYTYRQLSALGRQAMPISVGATENVLLVDQATHETLSSVIGTARAVGLAPGQAILDFTGDGPGLIYALEGRPVGLAWLPGGYPGSQAMAARIVERLPLQALQRAWLLSSDNNPRAIKEWQQALAARLGPGTHELVATVHIRAPYRWGRDAPERLSVNFFRPLALPN